MPSLYVHVPFCVRKCAYCAFYSVPLKNSKVQDYLKGLKKEIDLRKKDASEGVSSLFVGGGTPTALAEEELEALFALLKQGFDIPEAVEQTIEGNPGTLTREKLQILRRAGINRISLGVQSFDDSLLRQIGRIHTVQDVREGVHLIREAGFRNLNLDLMFGLPGQTLGAWQDTLKKAVQLGPEHLSIYGLMVEEDTPLAQSSKLLTLLPDDDDQAEMYDWTREYLRESGYLHYETSNFARPGFECQHNLGYWQGEDYLGLGPGAVGCVQNVRSKNLEDIDRYLMNLEQNGLPLEPTDVEDLSEQERMAERMILGLRLSQGVNLASFKQEFGLDIRDIYRSVLERYLTTKVLILDEKTLKLNPDFWFVANGVLQEFV
ncbi:radical SAM family heme chaperone HemW [Desulfitobacterium metallireducens]|uniref:Heme chaperone HemW n=1 Tax=Desulfitobacterium metallireducens DSM 15288 TaxID=871968 RepID=W0EAH9_9FIRM|nr:radical SAM family heme chaperone HemW [Desulfitobacterium metallireducens]AHF07875.1 coproporphyrinogen III oxidase [Desulfitobacterium metallireducens DSM 15288]